ncbi:MAG: hypothetical protein ABSH51_07255 [Solirubrobacteraceae bacterium]|jgi:hypothetical protein
MTLVLIVNAAIAVPALAAIVAIAIWGINGSRNESRLRLATVRARADRHRQAAVATATATAGRRTAGSGRPVRPFAS